MKTLKDYLIIGSAIIIMVLTLKIGCSNPFPKLEPITHTIIQSDTVWSKDTLIVFKSIKKPIHDTLYILDSTRKDINIDSLLFIRIYNDSLVDSNLTLYSKVKVVGILDQLDLSYKLKSKPSLITNNITTTKIEFKPNKIQIYTGIQLGGNKTSFNISPFININIKKATIQYNYGVINNSHNIGVGYKIFNSRN